MPQVAPVRSVSRWYLAPAAVVVVATLGVGGYFLVQTVFTPHPRITTADLETVQNQVDVAVHNAGNNEAAGLSIYNKDIPEAADSVTKANLYLEASSLASDHNDFSVALSDAQKADAILHTDGSSSQVAVIYEQEGNATQAAAYYKKAAAEVKPGETGGLGSQYYLAEAAYVLQGGSQ